MLNISIIITSAVFSYYIRDIKKDFKEIRLINIY